METKEKSGAALSTAEGTLNVSVDISGFQEAANLGSKKRIMNMLQDLEDLTNRKIRKIVLQTSGSVRTNSGNYETDDYASGLQDNELAVLKSILGVSKDPCYEDLNHNDGEGDLQSNDKIYFSTLLPTVNWVESIYDEAWHGWEAEVRLTFAPPEPDMNYVEAGVRNKICKSEPK